MLDNSFKREKTSQQQEPVQIFKIEGTSQFIVKTDSEEYSFVKLEDAKRLAAELQPRQKSFEIKELPVGQEWQKWPGGNISKSSLTSKITDKLAEFWNIL